MSSDSNNDYVILAIDDEPAILNSYQLFLEDYGFEIVTAENGKIGIQRFNEVRPDLVICDIRMPEVDGLKVLEYIKTYSPSTPVIVVSGTGEAEDLRQAMKSGATDYLMKPIQSLSALRHTILNVLDKAE